MLDPNLDVLVVDDSETVRQVMRSLLWEIGMRNVREAKDGSIALQELKRRRADLVITDWHMPQMSGIELLRAIRRNEVIKDIPVLMLTLESDKENVIEAVQAGVNGYIVKSFNAKTIEKALNKIFK